MAARLGVSISGLARGGITEALTTEQIDALLAEEPEAASRRAGELPERADRATLLKVLRVQNG